MAESRSQLESVLASVGKGRTLSVKQIPRELMAELCATSLALMHCGTDAEQKLAWSFYQWWQHSSIVLRDEECPTGRPVSGGTAEKKLDIWFESNTIVTSDRYGLDNVGYARIDPERQLRDQGPFIELVARQALKAPGYAAWLVRVKANLTKAYSLHGHGKELA